MTENEAHPSRAEAQSAPPPTPPPAPQGRPYGLFVLLAVAAVLYVLLLLNALSEPEGGGESRIEAGYEALFIVVGLWLVLIFVVVNACVMGPSVPRWTAWLSVVLVPMAAVADAAALDMCSRGREWQPAVLLVGVFPALIVFYALWARLPGWQRAMPAERTSAVVWGAIFLLSALTFAAAA